MKDRIRKIRTDNGLTQEKFAERLGIKRNTVATYETGKSIPMDNVLKSICREFYVNEEWLKDGTGETYIEKASDFSEICAQIATDDEKAREAIMKYYSLSEADKKLWWNFMEKFMK